jgi:hypothetical protein
MLSIHLKYAFLGAAGELIKRLVYCFLGWVEPVAFTGGFVSRLHRRRTAQAPFPPLPLPLPPGRRRRSMYLARRSMPTPLKGPSTLKIPTHSGQRPPPGNGTCADRPPSLLGKFWPGTSSVRRGSAVIGRQRPRRVDPVPFSLQVWCPTWTWEGRAGRLPRSLKPTATNGC